MATKTGRRLNRTEVFKDTERLHKDLANYTVYVPASESVELNEKVKSGQISVTLKDVVEGRLDKR